MNKRTRPAVTITAIANELGLSVSAVSYVLNVSEKRNKVSDQTARRIVEAADRLGYVPNVLAQSLRKQRSGVIGVVFGTLAHDWAELALIGMRDVLDREGYLPFITVSHWDPEIEEREFNLLMQRRVEGIICVPNPANRDLYLRIARQGVPLVFLNDTLLDLPSVSHIAWDADRATQTAIEHLVENGYERIGFLGSDHQTEMTRARYRAYERTLAAAGLPLKMEWVYWEPVHTVTSSQSPGNAHDLVARMLQQAYFSHALRPDAFYATVDALALPVLSVLGERGVHVPEDVALIGMGDLPGTDFPGVGLSTMHEPIEKLGSQAGEVILELIKSPGREPIHRTVTGNELKARRTTQKVLRKLINQCEFNLPAAESVLAYPE